MVHTNNVRINPRAHQSSSNQWSRLEPSDEFHFEGLLNLSPSVERLVQIQEYKNEILILNLCINHEYGTCF